MSHPEIIKRNAPGTPEPATKAFHGSGVLEILPDGFGFLRGSGDNYQPGADDIYVSPSQIRRFDLRTGDVLTGMVRSPKDGERYNALIQVKEVNGSDPDTARGTPNFDEMTVIHPNQALQLDAMEDAIGSLIVSVFSPIGRGQRALLIAPPRTGASQLLFELADSIEEGNPDVSLMAIVIDTRPEEVTELEEMIDGEVAASTFDEGPSRHVQVAEIAIERAKRLVEQGRDVVIIIDSLTQLARAYNATLPGSGKMLASGIDAQAVHRVKRLFGAARNLDGIGSLTIIATVRSDTGARMDAHLIEELRAAANTEIQLSKEAASQRIFPAFDLQNTQTHRTDKMRSEPCEERAANIRTDLNGNAVEDLQSVLKCVANAKSTDELLDKLTNSGD